MLNTAIKAAIKAGREILKIYNDPNADFSVERKADNSPLTIADKASHQVINQLLKSTGLPVLSEEGRDISYEERKSWETFWMVDPLDGTKEFIKRNGEFTVNIALISKNKPVLGVIYVPVSKVIYVGEIQQGAWKLEETPEDATVESVKNAGSRLPAVTQKPGYTIVGSRSHANDETRDYIEERKKEHPQIDIISKGSSLKICMVAEGIADEYPRFGPTMEWDTAAGHAIANASGKKLWLTNLEKELSYNKKNLLNPYFIVK
ncbi:MAG: 3'(2'),5'-bisphosphate nucleotidase CysQ [Bacteroidota bacterium]